LKSTKSKPCQTRS